jgi:hypothetical protein
MTSARILELNRKLERNKQRVQDAFGALPPEGWNRKVYDDPAVWTAKDLLAHFVSAERSLLDLAKNIAAGGRGAPEGFDREEYNRREQAAYRLRPPREILDLFTESRDLTLQWLNKLKEEQLDRKGWHPGFGDATLETVLEGIHGHILLHLKDFKQSRPPSGKPISSWNGPAGL